MGDWADDKARELVLRQIGQPRDRRSTVLIGGADGEDWVDAIAAELRTAHDAGVAEERKAARADGDRMCVACYKLKRKGEHHDCYCTCHYDTLEAAALACVNACIKDEG